MALFEITSKERHTMELIEAVHLDGKLQFSEKNTLLKWLWNQLEATHGSTIRYLVSPGKEFINRPWTEVELVFQIVSLAHELSHRADVATQQDLQYHWIQLEQRIGVFLPEIEVVSGYALLRRDYFPLGHRV